MRVLQNIVCSSCQHVEKILERYVPVDFHGTISNSIRLQNCSNCGHHQINFETIIRRDPEDDQLEFPPVDNDPSLPSTISDPAVKRTPRKG